MQNRLYRLLIFGFTQLFILVILSNYFVGGTVNIMGNHAFKVGNKTFMIKEIKGLEFSTDDHYKKAFSQPYASFFILKDLDSNRVKLVLSGTKIRTNDYQSFDDIKSDYGNDSTLTVLSAKQSNNYLDVKFVNIADTSKIIFSRFYQAYPYFFQFLGTWEGVPNEMPTDIKRSLNAVSVIK